MPNSPRNVTSIIYKTNVPSWDLIRNSLSQNIDSFNKLDHAIKSYNDNLNQFNFDVLKAFINANSNALNIFRTINKLSSLARDLSRLVTRPVPMLRAKSNSMLILSQKQIACLLANAFFCTFPRRGRTNEEYKNYPLFNFASIYSSQNVPGKFKIRFQKLACLFNYYRRVIDNMPKGNISFERRYLEKNSLPDWTTSSKYLKKFIAESEGSIEKGTTGYTEVDFANKSIGGGVLTSGCVQEEIPFLIYPEMFVSRLFTECLEDDEAIIITGCEKYNKHQGYAETFEWVNDFVDNTPADDWGRHMTEVVVIDAIDFKNYNRNIQYQERYFKRELNKAYSGFYDKTLDALPHKPAIVTGKWGCGAFKGDKYLKSLLQIMAASEADRDIIFQTYGDTELEESINKFYAYSCQVRIKIVDMYRMLLTYEKGKIYEYSNCNVIAYAKKF